MKRILLILALAAFLLSGCSGVRHAVKQAKSQTSGTTDIVLDEDSYAMVLPNKDNTYYDLEAAGFEEIMKKANRSYKIWRPGKGSLPDQRSIIKQLTADHVSAIAVSPSDSEALTDVLKEAMQNGIDVLSFDHPANPEARELHISPADISKIAETLMDAVADLCGGSGEWAILSVSAAADAQNGWMNEMKSVMKEEDYKDLQLLEIAYGSDAERASYDQTKALLQNYPDLRVICATSSVGLTAACRAVNDAGADVKVTGLGLPSMMREFVSEEGCCPYFFMSDPVAVGKLAAYVSVALHGNQITGALNENFRADDMGEYQVTEAPDHGTCVITGLPLKVDNRNVDSWVEAF